MQKLHLLEMKVLNKYSQTSHSALLNKALRRGKLFSQTEAIREIKQNAIFILNEQWYFWNTDMKRKNV